MPEQHEAIPFWMMGVITIIIAAVVVSIGSSVLLQQQKNQAITRTETSNRTLSNGTALNLGRPDLTAVTTIVNVSGNSLGSGNFTIDLPGGTAMLITNVSNGTQANFTYQFAELSEARNSTTNAQNSLVQIGNQMGTLAIVFIAAVAIIILTSYLHIQFTK